MIKSPIFVLTCLLEIQALSVMLEETCQINGRRIYLEMGASGTVVSKNDDELKEPHSSFDFYKNEVCSLEIITCPSCVVVAKIGFLNISNNCGLNSTSNDCTCGYVMMYEMFHEELSMKKFCGHLEESEENAYKTKFKTLVIKYIGSVLKKHSFSIQYSAERNRQIISGSPDDENTTQVISTPYFPYKYPSDLSMEYVINCKSANPCKIMLIFTDFLLARASAIEFYDWNGERIYILAEDSYRPPLIITTGPILLVRFYANGRTNMGFKAEYSYLLESDRFLKPVTDCGGYADNLGGAITMMNLAKGATKIYYRCYWIIKPPKNYVSWKTDLYLKILDFSGFETGSTLTVRNGITSEGEILETETQKNSSVTSPNFHVVPITKGFYVSLNGVLMSQSKLVVVYAAFSYKDCFIGSNFMCENKKCVSISLVCDRFDHCGDNSDEPESCSHDSRYLHKPKGPNFYFPKSPDYDLKVTLALLLVCGLGIVGLIFGSMLLLYKMNAHVHNRTRFQDHMQTINAILEEGNFQGEEVEVITSDEPPTYEAPPPYEEITSQIAPSKKIRRMSPKTSEPSSSVRCKDATTSDTPRENLPGTSRQMNVPRSPPPAYKETVVATEPAVVHGSFIKRLGADDIRMSPGTFKESSRRRWFSMESYFMDGFSESNLVNVQICRDDFKGLKRSSSEEPHKLSQTYCIHCVK